MVKGSHLWRLLIGSLSQKLQIDVSQVSPLQTSVTHNLLGPEGEVIDVLSFVVTTNRVDVAKFSMLLTVQLILELLQLRGKAHGCWRVLIVIDSFVTTRTGSRCCLMSWPLIMN